MGLQGGRPQWDPRRAQAPRSRAEQWTGSGPQGSAASSPETVTTAQAAGQLLTPAPPPLVLLADKEGGRPPDEVVGEVVPGYRARARGGAAGVHCGLGLSADPSLPRVQVMRLTLLSEQAPGPVTMDLTGDLAVLKDQVFVLKEGADYRVRITFKVHKEIVSGLKCLHHTYRRGLCVDKATYMVGSYGPSAQEYEFVTPVEEAPRGVLARGHYAVTSVFTDDDRTDHLSWEWGLHISRDWQGWTRPRPR
ncbi:rho GDP-dissociation inhibitor 3, partial [Tupaia chinensis]|uniref:rho GDP-dissociation inhibitor 3 n=1 Tax=Tupaia chinensis TaxID=246437 RepID=UPI000FFB27BC